MKRRMTVRFLPIAGAAALFFLIGATATAGATTQSPEVSVPSTAVTHVTLTLGDSTLKPGQRTKIVATVRPRVAGRIVYLRVKHPHRFVNVASAVTNNKGEAIFHRVFHKADSYNFRASVVANVTFPAAVSKSAIEHVVIVLPFTLASGQTLQEGATGAQVLLLQQRMTALGYWMGTPNGNFGDATVQAVYALEKAAGINRSGIVGPQFVAALNAEVVPKPRTTSGDAIDVDLERDLVMFVKNGQLKYTLNTSSGGGYTYTQDGVTNTAITPRGVYSINRAVNALVVDSLGSLWRPRFFYEGFAIHGDTYVPPEPESHGCVRVSNEAIDWIWTQNLAPVGMQVWLY